MMCRNQKVGSMLVGLAMAMSLLLTTATAADKPQSYTGEVSDAMCGAHHMGGTPAECTRACVSKGSKYSLVVADKVYTLDTADKKNLDALNQLAGAKAKVTGSLDGDTIKVASVTAAK
jgi:hypothetical protein